MLHADIAVLKETKEAIHHLTVLGIKYGRLCGPLSDAAIRDALRKLRIIMRSAPLGTEVLEAVSPPAYGQYLMLLSTDATREQRQFAIRHGVGHVAAGHVSEMQYLQTNEGYMSHEERVADTFALADHIPKQKIALLRKIKTPDRMIRLDIVRAIRRVLRWPEDRVWDRANLRLALYNKYRL